jgi:hypothetical protein
MVGGKIILDKKEALRQMTQNKSCIYQTSQRLQCGMPQIKNSFADINLQRSYLLGCWPTWIRTKTDRTKICSATITQ